MKYSKILVSTIFCIGLLGCNPEPESTQADEVVVTTPSTQTPETESDNASLVPADAPTYNIAMTGRQPPFTFMDEYGNSQGIDVDIIKAVAEVEGFNVEIYIEPLKGIIASINNGDNDILMGGLSYSDDRNEKFTLSDPYLYVPSAILYDKTKVTIESIEDVETLRFAGVPVVQQSIDIKTLYPDIEFIPTDTTFLAFEKLIRGEADFMAEDIQVLEYLALQYPDFNLAILPYQDEEDSGSQQVALVKKGNIDLIEKLNHGFAVLTENGEIERIEKKWLDKEL